MIYDWAYLCNNDRRLAITLRALPKEPFADLKTMHICWASHLDHPSRPESFAMTAASLAPSWLNWKITDLSSVADRVPSQLQTYFKNDKARWALGMKLFLPYVLGTPYLYTDDDVLVFKDPLPLMFNSFGSKGCFHLSYGKRDIATQLFDAFDLQPNELPAHVHYNYGAMDAGVWFHKYPDDWRYRLECFATMPYLLDLTTRNLELRCLDQRFLTCFGIKHGWDAITIGNGFAPPTKLRDTFGTKQTFFHYKSSSKERWMKLLEEWLDGRA